MAGRELDETGKSPAEIRRLKARRKRMLAAAERRGGFNTRRGKAPAGKGGRTNAGEVDKPDATTASPKKAKFGAGPSKTIMHNGKSMANVTGDQLKKTGLSLPAYMSLWKKLGTRPTKAAAADAREVDKPGTGKGNAKVKGRSPLVSSVEDRGRRNNKRIQRLAEAAGAPTTTTTKRSSLVSSVTDQGRRDNKRAQRPAQAAEIARRKKAQAAEIARRKKLSDATSKEYKKLVDSVRGQNPTARKYVYAGSAQRPERKGPPSFTQKLAQAADIQQPRRLPSEADRRTPDAIDRIVGKTPTARGLQAVGVATAPLAARRAIMGAANKLRNPRRGQATSTGVRPTKAELQALKDGVITQRELRRGPLSTFKKGGVVKAPKKASKKSIDGIASKGKTRAKHR